MANETQEKGPWVVRFAEIYKLQSVLNEFHRRGIAFDPKNTLISTTSDGTAWVTIVGFDTTWKSEPTEAEAARFCLYQGCDFVHEPNSQYCERHNAEIEEAVKGAIRG
jgi:hypothetical protein